MAERRGRFWFGIIVNTLAATALALIYVNVLWEEDLPELLGDTRAALQKEEPEAPRPKIEPIDADFTPVPLPYGEAIAYEDIVPQAMARMKEEAEDAGKAAQEAVEGYFTAPEAPEAPPVPQAEPVRETPPETAARTPAPQPPAAPEPPTAPLAQAYEAPNYDIWLKEFEAALEAQNLFLPEDGLIKHHIADYWRKMALSWEKRRENPLYCPGLDGRNYLMAGPGGVCPRKEVAPLQSKDVVLDLDKLPPR